ncbi:restriction endonuclease [Mesobacillus subterraneus]|uniref:restriction endonuclease n=1 Tax=Mesobacillus subterraneus TaxID=285983 RepID=UPI001CFF0444|nr:restriction endonuclease [Mesobacillus subterraneus]WLR54618.1 restriction endonuclease [Mesobacillus subterraneus]
MKKSSKKQDKQTESIMTLISMAVFGLVFYLTESLITAAIALLVMMLIAVIFVLVLNQNKLKKLRDSGIFEIDMMDGTQFEHYLRELYLAYGYKATVTRASGDFGADLILNKNGRKIVVQAKRYKKNVGVKAVQEVKSAELHYGADESWVVTNSYFTKAAYQLANSNSVILIDRDQLVKDIVFLQSKSNTAM